MSFNEKELSTTLIAKDTKWRSSFTREPAGVERRVSVHCRYDVWVCGTGVGTFLSETSVWEENKAEIKDDDNNNCPPLFVALQWHRLK